MGHVGPSQVVRAQRATPPLYGLLVSAVKPDPADIIETVDGAATWWNGIKYEPEGCVEGNLFDPCDHGSEVVIDPSKPENIEWFPYPHVITEVCSTFSERDERLRRVRDALLADTERALGNELWTGDETQTATAAHPATPWPNTWLADPADTISSGAVGLAQGLSCLEQYLADNNSGQQGMIHATVQTLERWDSLHLLYRDGPRIVTITGNIVVASPGYTGDSPTGPAADGDIWAYATDLIRIWRSPPKVEDLLHTIDRRENTVQVQAEETLLAEWQRCRHAGIQLDLSLCSSGS